MPNVWETFFSRRSRIHKTDIIYCFILGGEFLVHEGSKSNYILITTLIEPCVLAFETHDTHNLFVNVNWALEV